MSGIAASRLKGRGFTYLDFSTAGGLTIVEPALNLATGGTLTQDANGGRLRWTAANSTTPQQVGLRYTPGAVLDFTNTDTFAVEIDFPPIQPALHLAACV